MARLTHAADSVCTLGSSEMLSHVAMRVEGGTAAADHKYIFRTFPGLRMLQGTENPFLASASS